LVTSQKIVFCTFWFIEKCFWKKVVLQILLSNLNHNLIFKFWKNLFSLIWIFFVWFELQSSNFKSFRHYFCFPFKSIKTFENMTKKNLHSKNWSVVSALITAQKQYLGKCRFSTWKCLFKCENDTYFIFSSVENNT
jgi:hypothetical protein